MNQLIENPKSPGKSSRASRLPFFEENANLDINNITVEDFLRRFSRTNLELYFDRSKILDYLKMKASSFEKEILDRVFCPRSGCKSSDTVKVLDKEGSFNGYFRCQKCKEKFKPKRFVRSRFNNRTIALTLVNFSEGKTPRETFQLLVTERTSILLDHDVLEGLPDEKTLYDILMRSAEKLANFDELMILFLGGIPCEVLFCDDAFARKKLSRRQPSANKKQANQRRFSYAIVTMARESRFTIGLHIVSTRDKKAFRDAFGITEGRLRSLPKALKGDKLAAMEHAAPFFFPKNLVKHIFRRLKPWQKKDLMRIERKIKDMRKTISKHQKSGSLKILTYLAILSMVYLNYICPMEEALEGKSPAQTVGIPYPFHPYDWRKFMVWVDWVFSHLPEILKAALKQIPGSCLEPCSDTSEELFKRKKKARKQ